MILVKAKSFFCLAKDEGQVINLQSKEGLWAFG